MTWHETVGEVSASGGKKKASKASANLNHNPRGWNSGGDESYDGSDPPAVIPLPRQQWHHIWRVSWNSSCVSSPSAFKTLGSWSGRTEAFEACFLPPLAEPALELLYLNFYWKMLFCETPIQMPPVLRELEDPHVGDCTLGPHLAFLSK